MGDLIFSGVFERHPRLTLAIVEFELTWAPHLLSTIDYTFRERRHAPERLLPPQRRLQLPGGRHRHSPAPTLPSPACGGGSGGGVDNMMWGSDYPHSESTFP
jgi:hypothetical protein